MPRTERPQAVTPARGEYLKRILQLEASGAVTTGRLARELNVKDASVTGMLERLAQAGWVEHDPYRGARLTEEGARIAQGLLRAHNLLSAFLRGALGYSAEAAGVEAEQLKHHVSEEFLQRLEMWLAA